MPDTEVYKLLFGYSRWASARLLEAIRTLPPEQLRADPGLGSGTIWGLLSHLIAAEEIWISRMGGISPTAVPDYSGLPNLEAMAQVLMGRHDSTVAFVATLTPEDLAGDLVYRTTVGIELRQPLWQLLLHLANHATDHRSQIGAAINRFGIASPQLDLIFYLRS